MNYRVTHTTTYDYSEAVTLCHNQAHLAPRTFERQSCEKSQLLILPMPTLRRAWRDYFGNRVDYFSVEEQHKRLAVTSISLVTVRPPELPEPKDTPSWESVRDEVAAAADDNARANLQFTLDSKLVTRSAEGRAYAEQSFTPGRPLLESMLDMTARIHREFKYDSTATTVNTPTADVFRTRRGVCQDFAHLGITCLRSLGLAARYVSGYLLTEPPPGKPKLVGADMSHAWVSVYISNLGWVDFDPTNNAIPDVRHVTLAWGRDYSDVCPIQGVFLGGGKHTMHVAVDVSPTVA